ncbi:hypothetical protein Tco_0621599, partial [Tanacetum coccineum]
MAGPSERGGPEGTDDREETPPPLTKEQIEGHVSALKSFIKSHNRKNKGNLIRLDFEIEDTGAQEHNVAKGKEVVDEDLGKTFKEARRTLFTRRIIEFAGPRYKMPTNIKLYDDKVPTTVNEMMERLDDFVRSEEAYANTELPKGETGESHRKISLPFNGRDTRPFRNARPVESRRDEFRNSYKGRDAYRTSKTRDDRAPYPSPRGEYNRRVTPVLTLNSLTKHSKEILATETQLRLPVPRPTLNPLKSGNTDRYCDYHQEKGHYTNDCIQLRKQLEMALESGKLNHLVKDVRQRGRGSRSQDNPQQAKIINVISVNSIKDKKRKVREATESWMNIPISFPAISSEDISEEPLIVKAEVEGYLVRQVYVDEGSSVEVMFEHCFENLNPKINGRLKETQTDLVGFAGEVSKPLGKIELEDARFKDPSSHPFHYSLNDEVPNPKRGGHASHPGSHYGLNADDQNKQMIEESMTIRRWSRGERRMQVRKYGQPPSFPEPLVTVWWKIIRTGKDQLNCPSTNNMDEKILLADIAETFDNLKKINMKLNLKKCSFGVEEGKFLGYMVTSEGIRANPKK